MVILQIEHPVPNYDGWKKAFDSDPVERHQSGVIRYTVYRKADDSNYIVINLEFEKLSEAENMLNSLKKLWNRVEGQVMDNPQAKILEIAEHKEY
jgi:hypothetical protein